MVFMICFGPDAGLRSYVCLHYAQVAIVLRGIHSDG